jgi:hypothetical protein
MIFSGVFHLGAVERSPAQSGSAAAAEIKTRVIPAGIAGSRAWLLVFLLPEQIIATKATGHV